MNPQKLTCFAHRHMNATEYAVYDVCCAMARNNNGIVFFSGPRIAKKFRAMSRNTPYTAVKALVENGWFVKKKESGHRRDGTRTPTHYRVLDHKEWCALHPDSCPDDSEAWQTSLSKLEVMADLPSQLEGRPSQSECNPSQSECGPSQLQGTNLYKPPITNTHTYTDISAPPSQLEVMATHPSVLDGANIGPAHPLEGGPYPQIETVNEVVSSITSALGVTGDAGVKAWRKTVEGLNVDGHDPQLIDDVLRFYIDGYGPHHVRTEGAENFVVSFPWLLSNMTAKQVEELEESHVDTSAG